MRNSILIAASISLLSTACSGLTLDGREFAVETCSSGQAWGFVGVDLTDREGRRIFVARTKAKRALVSVFEAQTTSVELGHCGDIEVSVDEVPGEPYVVSGSLSVECDAAGHTLEGRYSFDRCR